MIVHEYWNKLPFLQYTNIYVLGGDLTDCVLTAKSSHIYIHSMVFSEAKTFYFYGRKGG